MDFIGDAIEWIANSSVAYFAPFFPLALLGLLGLYLIWLVIGYLRVAQVGVRDTSPTLAVASLPRGEAGTLAPPRGVPYCPVDGLRYPEVARVCTRCESDLMVVCANCGATIRAADESCYRCGTHQTTLAADH
ncbi:MAG TPA: hypothetical protein VJA85_00265 [Candidatus Limnocylindria bacterium]|nr:hypothetical protein [Candidatus Limnocylindria bacterium]